MAGKSTYKKLNELKNRLLDYKHPATVQELAEFMDCNTRTIFRHLNTLEIENCGLKKTKDSPYRYYLLPTQPKRPESLIKGLESINELLTASAEVTYAKLLRKVISHFKGNDEDMEFVNGGINLDEDFIVDLGPFSEFDPKSRNYEAQEHNVDKFLDAIKKRIQLNVTYETAYSGTVQEMCIKPMKLILRIGTLYLACLNEANETKLLAVRRIKRFSTTGKYFAEIPFDAKEYYKYCYGKFGSSSESNFPKIKFTLAVKSPWLQTQINESHFNPPVKIKKQNPMTVEFVLYDTPDMRSWLLSILPDVEIIEPQKLKDSMKELLKKASNAL